MQFGPGASSGETTTVTTQSPWDALAAVSKASGVDPNETSSVARGIGQSPHDFIGRVPQYAAARQASPGASAGQLAAEQGWATPSQAQAIDKQETVSAGGEAGKTGAFADIFGDFFEAAYPFLMFGLAVALFVVALLIGLVALGKSPAGRAISKGGIAAAGKAVFL